MDRRRDIERTDRVMAAVKLLEEEAKAGFPVCNLEEAEYIDLVAGLAGAKARRRVRISLEQGYAKSMPRKERLAANIGRTA